MAVRDNIDPREAFTSIDDEMMEALDDVMEYEDEDDDRPLPCDALDDEDYFHVCDEDDEAEYPYYGDDDDGRYDEVDFY